MKYLLFLIINLFSFFSIAQTHTVTFLTSYGNFKVLLYDFTPNHRDVFLNEINNATYKKTLFNRVIENFVIQGGEHDNDIAQIEQNIPINKRKRLAPEFNAKAFHKIGALGAGRDENDAKGSFFHQIYFVVGKKVSDEDLKQWEQKKGIFFTEEQRKEYLTNGGLPRLDNEYTIFGEIIEGLDVVLRISKVATDDKDYPLQPIYFEVSIDENNQ